MKFLTAQASICGVRDEETKNAHRLGIVYGLIYGLGRPKTLTDALVVASDNGTAMEATQEAY